MKKRLSLKLAEEFFAKQFKTIDPAEAKSRENLMRKTESHKFKTQYGRIFNTDKTKDIEIVDIMQKTLNGAFLKPSKENDICDESSRNFNQTSPYFTLAVKKHVLEKESPSPNDSTDNYSETKINFHQNHLDTFPFRNGLQKVKNP